MPKFRLLDEPLQQNNIMEYVLVEARRRFS